MAQQSDDSQKDKADPLLIPGAWPRIYVAVLCYLFILITALYVLSRLFSY